MLPHATKVPAEKKDIKRESPPMDQGTDSPPAKKDLISVPVLENNIPIPRTNPEKITMTNRSMVEFIQAHY
jgi:hypothetical protein